MTRTHPILPLLLLAAAVALTGAGCRRTGAPLVPAAKDPYGFVLTANDGSHHPLEQHRGKVLLIVNTASECGFTGQYAGLQTLWDRYGSRGLVVIAQPSSDFFGQEPRSDQDIARFCADRYRTTFPLMAKAHVNGEDQLPLYRWLTVDSAKPGRIAWNFTKFIVGRDGQVVARFGPTTEPLDQPVISAIEGALAASAP